MNLQATSRNPHRSAIALDDKRLIKAILETAQIYCTVKPDPTYRPTHANHPITLWSSKNLPWLISFHKAAAAEYTHRFNRVHLSTIKIKMTTHQTHKPTSFLNMARNKNLGIDFTHIPRIHLAYRMYMNKRWQTGKPRWTNRHPPLWISIQTELITTKSSSMAYQGLE